MRAQDHVEYIFCSNWIMLSCNKSDMAILVLKAECATWMFLTPGLSLDRTSLLMSTYLPSWAKVCHRTRATNRMFTLEWATCFRAQLSGSDTRWYRLGSTVGMGPVTSRKRPWASAPFVSVPPGGTQMYVTFLKMRTASVTKMTFIYEFAKDVPINLFLMRLSKEYTVCKHQTDKCLL